MSAITHFIPKNHLSYLTGLIVHLPLPSFIWTPLIQLFAKAYKINLDEAEKPLSEYKSLGDFFVRRLKSGLRPLGSTWAVHPADSVVTQTDQIKQGQLIQAKDKKYEVNDFISDPTGFEKYNNGHFLTYYLCPTDYHRVHSPVDGEVVKVIHIPGALWPVNQWSTNNIYELFSINERIYVEINTEKGLVGVVFVAATNVGQIELSFDSEIRGNQFKVFKPLVKEYQNIKVKKGDELGMFRMGSTVVMLYQNGTLNTNSLNLAQYQNKQVQVNSDFC